VQKLSDKPTVDVIAPARPIADDHPQRLAAIKGRDRLRLDRRWRRNERGKDRRGANDPRYPAAARSFWH
jgi:hypothetical protein